MITEKIIAKEFNSLWEECLPLLTPSFVSLLNAANAEDLTDNYKSKFHHIPVGPNIEKHDLVAELSFQLAKVSMEDDIKIADIGAASESFKKAYSRSTSFIKRYNSIDLEMVLSEDEIKESCSIANQYDHFFEFINPTTIEFSPLVAGSGFLGLCEADLSIDDTLYEVKTVSRNISGNDVKQLVLYLALHYTSGNKKWTHAGFFNPRKCTHCKFSVEHLIYRTSGGKSTTEVFQDIVEILANRGIEIDSIF